MQTLNWKTASVCECVFLLGTCWGRCLVAGTGQQGPDHPPQRLLRHREAAAESAGCGAAADTAAGRQSGETLPTV